MVIEDDTGLKEILSMDRIAVVGCSRNAAKAAHTVPSYLQDRGYTVIPVNPNADEILGEEAYDRLEDVPGTVDIVEVFRPREEVPGIVDAAIERGDARVVWMQIGIEHPDAAARAEEAGLQVVQDRCMRVEHRRLLDG